MEDLTRTMQSWSPCDPKVQILANGSQTVHTHRFRYVYMHALASLVEGIGRKQ